MTAANHLPLEGYMDPDRQELESTKYLYHPLLFVKLRSGNIGVCSGLGGRTVKEIIDPNLPEARERFFEIILSAATSRSMSAAEQRTLPSTQLDLNDLNLDGLFKSLDLGDFDV